MRPWSPDSWREREALQQPTYPDGDALDAALTELGRLPPLVTSWEIESLRERLAAVARGEAFLLQGGDCAESFDDCTPDSITSKLKILLQMSLVLVHGARKPVVRVGRIAGQYAKPRSSDLEVRDDKTLPSYRGDLVNRSPFTDDDRRPDPWLLVKGYERASLTLNFIRALADGGFADIRHPEYWDLEFAKLSELSTQYEAVVAQIRESLEFMEVIGGSDLAPSLKRVAFYTSHEALALAYEAAQTRRVPNRDGFYNLSTHMPWIGMRTAQVEGAHVEFCRGITNPFGIKIGPAMDDAWLVELLDRVDPERVPGRVTLIHRMGAENVDSKLPGLISSVQRVGREVVWCCDPMHGNTETTDAGVKTRRFDLILKEIEESLDVHNASGTRLGGVHFEMTGEDVTECTGGARGLADADLSRAYHSRVDPRLNYEQALEMALRIATRLRAG
jgi:3-deoxy-7-phosphoheptulonate synthase